MLCGKGLHGVARVRRYLPVAWHAVVVGIHTGPGNQ
jgi:hypothetical protein